MIVGRRRPLPPEILDQADRVEAKLPIFDLLSPVALQPQHLAKKVQLALRGSLLRTLQWAEDEHPKLSLSPLKDGSKTESFQNLNDKLR